MSEYRYVLRRNTGLLRGSGRALHRVRVSEVLALCRGEIEWFCLGTTADGSPRHPLYVKRDAQIVRWTPREVRT